MHLHYDNPLGRLTGIKRVVNNEAVETLTQYRYDEHGQLSAVINRNGDTVRSFSYADGLMVTHSNALGLGCHYRWQTLGDKPRVVEHWTSDGEQYHFRYDPWGNLIEKRSGHSKLQNFAYDCENRLVKAETYVGDRLESTGSTGMTAWDGGWPNRLKSMAKPSRSAFSGKACECCGRKRLGRASCTCTSRVAMRRWRGLIRLKGKGRRSITSIRIRLEPHWS